MKEEELIFDQRENFYVDRVFNLRLHHVFLFAAFALSTNSRKLRRSDDLMEVRDSLAYHENITAWGEHAWSQGVAGVAFGMPIPNLFPTN